MHKSKNEKIYNRVQKEIKKEMRKAKERRLRGKCEEIKTLEIQNISTCTRELT